MRIIKFFIASLIFSLNGYASLDFSSLIIDYSGIPDFLYYRARDKSILPYRYYPSAANTLIITLHGSAYHSRYLYKLAKKLSEQNIAQIVTPDLRGHGFDPQKRGDIDYQGQLDDDLDDLMQFCLEKYKPKAIIVAGHSSGGGLALRLAGNPRRVQADAYLFLAPYFAHNSPTLNQKSGWAKPRLFNVIVANILNGFGLHWFDHAITVNFNLPEKYRDGSETLSYSHALMSSYSPTNYQSDLARISKKTLVMVGEQDEAMVARSYEQILSPNKSIELKIIPNITHMSIVTDDNAIGLMIHWLAE